ncbi:hypothetical protein JW933_02685 [candidate division FCPU426 bacterium]|nr:hypothetical protein [candidate division FCPU426 bacterium]
MDETLSASAQNIKKQLQALMELQQLDNEIIRRNHDRDRLAEDTQRHKASIDNLRASLHDRRIEIENLLKDRREAERDSKQKTEEIRKMGGQLFEVKTNEAYSTLQKEMQQKKQENALLEERILEMMVAEDEKKAALHAAEEDIKRSEQEADSHQNANEREINRLDKEIAGFQTQWDAAAREVRNDYLDLYKRLRNAKGGRALARIENDVCTGCRLSIRPQATIELKKYRGLLYCDNCARILYVD